MQAGMQDIQALEQGLNGVVIETSGCPKCPQLPKDVQILTSTESYICPGRLLLDHHRAAGELVRHTPSLPGTSINSAIPEKCLPGLSDHAIASLQGLACAQTPR